MKKVSKASLISAIIIAVAAIVAIVYGFVCIRGFKVVTRYAFSIYTEYRTYTELGLGLIITGGFAFLGSILLFGLSAMTACADCDVIQIDPEPHKCCHCHDEEVVEEQEATL